MRGVCSPDSVGTGEADWVLLSGGGGGVGVGGGDRVGAYQNRARGPPFKEAAPTTRHLLTCKNRTPHRLTASPARPQLPYAQAPAQTTRPSDSPRPGPPQAR